MISPQIQQEMLEFERLCDVLYISVSSSQVTIKFKTHFNIILIDQARGR
jgi:hypothetical protein